MSAIKEGELYSYRLLRMSVWIYLFLSLLAMPYEYNNGTILAISLVVLFTTFNGFYVEAKWDPRRIIGLHNFVWAAFVLYSTVLYLSYSITDISYLIGMDDASVRRAARISFISVAATGAFLEVIRSKVNRLQDIAYSNISHCITTRQYWIAVLLLAFYLYNFLATDTIYLILEGNRFATTKNFETGKMWFIQYLMTGVTIAFIYQYCKRPISRNFDFYLGSISIGMFWMIYLMLGNRRGIITIALAYLACLVARTEQFRKAINIVVIVFIFSGLIGVFRLDTSEVASENTILLTVANFIGEFIYPSYTLVETLGMHNEPTLSFTWLTMGIDYFLSLFSGEQFYFLGQRFANSISSPNSEAVMGFAYLPITESYLNFGIFGAILSGPMMLGSIFGLAWIFRKKPIVYLLLFALALDINRSEFTAMFMQLIIIAFGIIITAKVRI